jgi:hypothetical protein
MVFPWYKIVLLGVWQAMAAGIACPVKVKPV